MPTNSAKCPEAMIAIRPAVISVVGTRDPYFPVSVVRATRDYLTERGYPAELKEIEGHDHDYYRRSKGINAEVWKFLSEHSLEHPPYYTEYPFAPFPTDNTGDTVALTPPDTLAPGGSPNSGAAPDDRRG